MTSQELKNSILQLAVQGKLVSQDPNDEPAAALLNRIKAEREKRIKEGTLSIDKKHTADPITEDDILYDLPDKWEWVRFADIVTFYSGKTPQRQHASYWTNGNIPWVSIADMSADASISTTKENISEVAFDECFSGKISPAGTMIMSFKLTIGKVSILEMDAVHNEAIISIFPTASDSDSLVLKNYLFKVMPLIATTGNVKNAIKGKTLNATSISNLMIPLPPLAEQERIIAKIEELLPLVEEYDKAEKKLSALNTEFPDKLRKSILQQAVQGKLTERNPADEPASELIKRIRKEKAKLIAEGKGRADKPYAEITDDELPFDIPDGWSVIRIGELGFYRKGPFGSSLTKQMFVPAGPNSVKVYEQKNAIQKDWRLGEYYIKREYFEAKMKGFEVFPGDIIVSCAGTIGESYVMPSDCEQGIINQALMRMKIVDAMDLEYFLLYFDYVLKATAQKNSKGAAIKNIPPFEILKNMIIPLPPLAEQKRILARVEELLMICDGLK